MGIFWPSTDMRDANRGTRSAGTSLEERMFAQNQANRNQLLGLLGFGPGGTIAESGGLFDQPLFSGILQNPLSGTVGDVTGALPPMFGGAGDGGQPAPSGGMPISQHAPSGEIPISQHAPGDEGGGGSLFDQLLGSRGQFGEEIMGRIGQFGESQRARIGRDFESSVGSAMADLEARGLGSSSLVPGQTSFLEEGRQQAMLGLEDALLGQEVGALGQIGEGIAGDIGQELDRGLGRRGQSMDFLQGLFGDIAGIF